MFVVSGDEFVIEIHKNDTNIFGVVGTSMEDSLHSLFQKFFIPLFKCVNFLAWW